MEAPAPINSASLHPEKDFFVAGGEDFKLYKFDYSTKEELGEKMQLFTERHLIIIWYTASFNPAFISATEQ